MTQCISRLRQSVEVWTVTVVLSVLLTGLFLASCVGWREDE